MKSTAFDKSEPTFSRWIAHSMGIGNSSRCQIAKNHA